VAARIPLDPLRRLVRGLENRLRARLGLGRRPPRLVLGVVPMLLGVGLDCHPHVARVVVRFAAGLRRGVRQLGYLRLGLALGVAPHPLSLAPRVAGDLLRRLLRRPHDRGDALADGRRLRAVALRP
jgi:hypothetical protein